MTNTHDKSQNIKIDRLMKTMHNFFEQRKKDHCGWYNGRLKSKQRKYMQSIIKQAKKINEETL
jgi:hypothetical protein